ncbi:hypothetical protein GCM10027355_19090 [Haloplanus salinarum]
MALADVEVERRIAVDGDRFAAAHHDDVIDALGFGRVTVDHRLPAIGRLRTEQVGVDVRTRPRQRRLEVEDDGSRRGGAEDDDGDEKRREAGGGEAATEPADPL